MSAVSPPDCKMPPLQPRCWRTSQGTVHLGLCGRRPRLHLWVRVSPNTALVTVLAIGYCRTFRPPIGRAHTPLPPVQLTPARPGPTAGCSPIPDRLGASWPAPRRGPRGCQAGRAPACLPSTKRLCRACRGLAGGQAASGKSRERCERRGAQGGAPSSSGRWRLLQLAPTSPPGPRPAHHLPPPPIPLSTCILLVSQSLGILLPPLLCSPCLP